MNQSAHTILNTLSANSPNQYNVLKRQMVKQLQSNKSEILKMRNIADGIIKLKDLL
jgi:outer membrane lipopolysaccharide assembly protein LptE/RlpB